MSLAGDPKDDGSDPFDMFMDWMATNRGALVAVAAGNDSGTICQPGGCYNQITVGGLDRSMTGPAPGPSGNGLGSGPTPDGRCKPDILAPGTHSTGPGAGGVDDWPAPLNPPNDSWDSGAIPFVAGVADVRLEYWEHSRLDLGPARCQGRHPELRHQASRLDPHRIPSRWTFVQGVGASQRRVGVLLLRRRAAGVRASSPGAAGTSTPSSRAPPTLYCIAMARPTP